MNSEIFNKIFPVVDATRATGINDWIAIIGDSCPGGSIQSFALGVESEDELSNDLTELGQFIAQMSSDDIKKHLNETMLTLISDAEDQNKLFAAAWFFVAYANSGYDPALLERTYIFKEAKVVFVDVKMEVA